MRPNEVCYVFLSNKFYQKYNFSEYPEIEKKLNRPYIILLTKIESLTFAIPFRSNIRHKYTFITDKVNAYRIDYSKAVVISNQNYIDGSRIPHIRPQEQNAMF
ncbi:MAG: hypothetical protein LBF23_04025 [Endomicrobium sp.]|jgi:protein AbiQ|nr:hypothetical protein [Endomicrobium sp.]